MWLRCDNLTDILVKPTLSFSFDWMPGWPKKSIHEWPTPPTACKLPVSRWHLREEQVSWKEAKSWTWIQSRNQALLVPALETLAPVTAWRFVFAAFSANPPRITTNLPQDGSCYFKLLCQMMGSHPTPSPAARALESISSGLWASRGTR